MHLAAVELPARRGKTHSGISAFANAGHRTALQQGFRFQQNSTGKPLFYVLNSTQYAGVYSVEVSH